MPAKQLNLPLRTEPTRPELDTERFIAQVEGFDAFGTHTRVDAFPDPAVRVPLLVNEFWTSKQRAGSSLHEISYRACFKPQLPRFFIERLTAPGDIVYDPFMGRGTTLIEAGLLGRTPAGCDVNPLCPRLVGPRLDPPPLDEIAARLDEIPLGGRVPASADELLTFYHPETLAEICSMRRYFTEREKRGEIDRADAWIRMVATNRLTGHSSGFFSVYTLPPNQAVTVDSQRKINAKRQQVPPRRPVVPIILKKSRTLMGKIDPAGVSRLRSVSASARLVIGSCDATPAIESNSVSLVVTSPPFLDVVNYQTDNWLRCWFNGIDAQKVKIWQLKKPEEWVAKMTAVFRELRRVLVPGGHVAFEVGEVRGGSLLMETLVVPAATDAGLDPQCVLVNDQVFTKTANCWGVSNLAKGTNTNRIIVLRKSV